MQRHGYFRLTDAVLQACIIHLTGHSAFQIINCMESAVDVLNAAQPVSIYRKHNCSFSLLYLFALFWSWLQLKIFRKKNDCVSCMKWKGRPCFCFVLYKLWLKKAGVSKKIAKNLFYRWVKTMFKFANLGKKGCLVHLYLSRFLVLYNVWFINIILVDHCCPQQPTHWRIIAVMFWVRW